MVQVFSVFSGLPAGHGNGAMCWCCTCNLQDVLEGVVVMLFTGNAVSALDMSVVSGVFQCDSGDPG